MTRKPYPTRRAKERARARRLAVLGNVAMGAGLVAVAAVLMVWAHAFGSML